MRARYRIELRLGSLNPAQLEQKDHDQQNCARLFSNCGFLPQTASDGGMVFMVLHACSLGCVLAPHEIDPSQVKTGRAARVLALSVLM